MSALRYANPPAPRARLPPGGHGAPSAAGGSRPGAPWPGEAGLAQKPSPKRPL